MFSYLHSFHAGCFADVHKHLTLVAILDYLLIKPAPFCVLDTHAGNGVYDLNSAESLKTAEKNNGINRLYDLNKPPALVVRFLELIKTYNQPGEQRFYPGSPAIILSMLRHLDKGLFVEKHPQAIAALRAFIAHKTQKLHLHERDSLEAMKALIPFTEKRGLVFIDPSYEIKSDYEAIIDATHRAYDKFSHGIFALWYPILSENYHTTLIRKLEKSAISKIWQFEWTPFPLHKTGMLGSGMIIINPPWQLDMTLIETFDSLNQAVYKEGQLTQRWLA